MAREPADLRDVTPDLADEVECAAVVQTMIERVREGLEAGGVAETLPDESQVLAPLNLGHAVTQHAQAHFHLRCGLGRERSCARLGLRDERRAHLFELSLGTRKLQQESLGSTDQSDHLGKRAPFRELREGAS